MRTFVGIQLRGRGAGVWTRASLPAVLPERVPCFLGLLSLFVRVLLRFPNQPYPIGTMLTFILLISI